MRTAREIGQNCAYTQARMNIHWSSCHVLISGDAEVPLYSYFLRSKQQMCWSDSADVVCICNQQIFSEVPLYSYYLSSKQQMCWSDCADAQADLHLCCSHVQSGFLKTRLKLFLARAMNVILMPVFYMQKEV